MTFQTTALLIKLLVKEQKKSKKQSLFYTISIRVKLKHRHPIHIGYEVYQVAVCWKYLSQGSSSLILERCINSNDDSGTHDSNQASDHLRKAISQLLSFCRMFPARIDTPSLLGIGSGIILLPPMLNTKNEQPKDPQLMNTSGFYGNKLYLGNNVSCISEQRTDHSYVNTYGLSYNCITCYSLKFRRLP